MITEEDSQKNERDAKREREQKLREAIGGITATITWFLVDLTFVYPESRERAYWFAIVFLAAQIVQITQLRLRTTIKALVVWMIIAPIGYHFWPATPPKETETNFWLVPADDPTPPNGCSSQGVSVPNDELLLLMGKMAVHTSRKDKFTVVQFGGCPLLKMQRTSQGIALDADIFNEDGKQIAHIENNEVDLSSGKYSRRKRPDSSTLIVYDEEGNEVLWVRYSNPTTVQIQGVFRCKGRNDSLTVTKDRVIGDGMSEGNSCATVGPNTIAAFVY